jgi:hypothetical protein
MKTIVNPSTVGKITPSAGQQKLVLAKCLSPKCCLSKRRRARILASHCLEEICRIKVEFNVTGKEESKTMHESPQIPFLKPVHALGGQIRRAATGFYDIRLLLRSIFT